MHALYRVIPIILGAVLSLAAKPAASVCQIINSPPSGGTVVRVRGLLKNTFPNSPQDPDYSDLEPLNPCSAVAGRLMKIRVVGPDAYLLDHPPTGYRPDSRSAHKLEHMIKSLRGGPILVTVVGVFYLITGQGTSGRPTDSGAGVYGAVIAVAAYKDPSIP